MAETVSKDSLLENALAALRAETGMEFCVYDFSYFSYGHPDLALTLRSRWHCSPFCMAVKKSREAQQRCVACELELGRVAARKGGPHIGMCHAGLTQVLVPVRRARQRIGMVSAGQVFVDARRARTALRDAARRYSLDTDELSSLAAKQAVASKDRLARVLPLLEIVRGYVEATVDTADLRRALARPGGGSSGRVNMPDVPNHFLARFYNAHEAAHRILGAIRRSYWEPRTQADYARALGVSPRAVNEGLRRHTGYTFREIIKKSRAAAAAFLLHSEGRSVSEVAYALGYEDVSSFSHAFKDVFGLSPTTYADRQVSVPEEPFILE